MKSRIRIYHPKEPHYRAHDPRHCLVATCTGRYSKANRRCHGGLSTQEAKHRQSHRRILATTVGWGGCSPRSTNNRGPNTQQLKSTNLLTHHHNPPDLGQSGQYWIEEISRERKKRRALLPSPTTPTIHHRLGNKQTRKAKTGLHH